MDRMDVGMEVDRSALVEWVAGESWLHYWMDPIAQWYDDSDATVAGREALRDLFAWTPGVAAVLEEISADEIRVLWDLAMSSGLQDLVDLDSAVPSDIQEVLVKVARWLASMVVAYEDRTVRSDDACG